jgi:8-amino-7-oxononanoate synthase
LINFSSNDYLGLARHPALTARASEWAERWGTGAGASRLVTGNLDLFAAIEEKIARAKGTEAALVLGSGFLLNGTVLAALFERDAVGPEPLVFSDRLNHASIHHGCRAAGVRQVRYRHNDMNHLEHLLERHAADEAARFIITESVFGMDGDRADLARLVELSDRHGAFLYVDEAHATGVLGPSRCLARSMRRSISCRASKTSGARSTATPIACAMRLKPRASTAGGRAPRSFR